MSVGLGLGLVVVRLFTIPFCVFVSRSECLYEEF